MLRGSIGFVCRRRLHQYIICGQSVSNGTRSGPHHGGHCELDRDQHGAAAGRRAHPQRVRLHRHARPCDRRRRPTAAVWAREPWCRADDQGSLRFRLQRRRLHQREAPHLPHSMVVCWARVVAAKLRRLFGGGGAVDISIGRTAGRWRSQSVSQCLPPPWSPADLQRGGRWRHRARQHHLLPMPVSRMDVRP